MVLFRESVLKSDVKILEEYLRGSSFFSKIASCKSAAVLKMNSFIGFFQVF